MEDGAEAQTSFRRELGLFDFTLLVVGAIIGDGIYVVEAMGAQSLGPAQLTAWLAAGILAAVIALAFVQCAAIDQDVGGSYSYARIAYGPLVGFLAGWTLYVGEWTAVSAFPLAFVNYFGSLVTPLTGAGAFGLKLLLIGSVTAINLLGVRQGAKTNDGLTIAKLLPLVLLIILGLIFLVARPGLATAHLRPFAPIGWGGFGKAILPIFWAYAGFELAVLPAAEVRSPVRTMPRGLIIGVTIATLFYLLVSLAVVVVLPWQETAASSHAVASVMGELVGTFHGPTEVGTRLMSLGGLISIGGVYVVFTLALSRLSFALAADGFLPAAFAVLHKKYRTPHFGLAFQAVSAIVFTTLFDLRGLLSTAVVFLSLCYVLTGLSALRLVRLFPSRALHLPGLRILLVGAIVAAGFLTAQASFIQFEIGFATVVFGLVLFTVGRSKRKLPQVKGPEHAAPELVLSEHHPHSWLMKFVRRESR
jgi:basic amino acid/polyamine antiporter, APA family